ncbi:hypothetical protein HOU41_gp135 [Proteus phage Stubb]|uniref:Uncharacterized protein n=1 Tax=Proteus phage Stubb TaxID=2315597 RepID=A0A3B8E0E4_9CAUD|nr:hypothetical protein HOU41_gp135 [Proteus phage Stubb]AYJ73209.1 hypothetical protein CPT_Stubb_084 [Proteus phage Stubb]
MRGDKPNLYAILGRQTLRENHFPSTHTFRVTFFLAASSSVYTHTLIN